MLKIFQIIKDKKVEIFPSNNIYTVFELGKYELFYTSENITSNTVFIEDIPVDSNKLSQSGNQIQLLEFRYFENYFGYASLNLNNEIFLFNIKIEKLKLSEIEDIFMYLWKKEDKLFNIFFSKSTYELDFKRKGFELGQTSKLISFIETFVSTFEQLYFSFENLPHTVLRKHHQKTKYDSHKVTADTVDWMLSNLDEIYFDNSFKGHYNSIKINNKYGLIENIKTSENLNSFNNYENQIILGAFMLLLKKLKELKFQISASINIQPNKDELYADFKDLKRIPFIKLFEDSTSLERKVIKIFNRYQKLFKDVQPKIEKPVLTTVFAQKLHYKKAFSLIKNLNDYKFDLFGEFKLLNISKLSKLYEVYNLYVILESIKQKLRLDFFNISAFSDRNDEIIEKITFDNTNYSIRLLYEQKFYDFSKTKQETELRRIDIKKGNYYNPDYIIEIFDKIKQKKKYYILDAKYSKLHTVRSNHLPDVIEKYIINTGINESPNTKVNSLNLIFPNEFGQKIIESDYFEPTIELTASKPNFENELKLFINRILEQNISENLIIK
ncbi:hypothetical protein [Chryseobacterium koreense]|jgi:hypothetical protein|uniref:Uncharacterized protein n=1 Tax=Chryseobacterium koreense CCUG 49689 TaxID=1304281 RepID=A0A0J7IVX4_9FLAO|nr:hypothetical protein [Chryseobacterium koreense]KMQ70117.1 hypothetical protein ACM44_14065 [Chryseobacterium koreense CCUG 49689]MBB5334839.1 hypothetical protein [Chryseobacterium koreense]